MAKWADPVLPNIGLIGKITNSIPPIIQYPPAVYDGSCTINGFFPWDDKCTESYLQCPTCQQIGQTCTCHVDSKPYYQGPSGYPANYNYKCTRACVGIDGANACSGGTYIGPSYIGTSLVALCSYPISDDNYNSYITGQFGFPQPFTTGMVNRYIVSKYIQFWNEEIYSNPKSIFHQSGDKTGRIDLRNSMLPYSLSKDFIDMLEQMTAYPIPTITDNNFYLLVTVYGNYIPDPPSATAITKYIQSYTGETLGTPYDPVLGAAVPYPNATSNYVVVDLATNKVYYQSVPTPPGATDPYIVGKIYMTPITNLSPVLMYLFNQRYRIPYDTIGAKGICDSIISQTGQVPGMCYDNTCQTGTFSPACKGTIVQHCEGPHTDPKTTASGFAYDMDTYYVTYQSSDCSCYNTQLPPPINRDQTRFAGMCFTNSCTLGESAPAMINAFGLTPEKCSQDCQEVYDWLASASPERRSYMASYLNNGRFQQLCGNIKPTPKTGANYIVLGIGLAITIGLCIGTYLISKSWIQTSILGVLLCALTAFLTFDLNGIPYCNGDQQGCKSRYSGVPIPTFLCSYLLGCECNLINKPCPKQGDECIAGICVTPKSPT